MKSCAKRVYSSKRKAMTHYGYNAHCRLRAYFCKDCRAWHVMNPEKK